MRIRALLPFLMVYGAAAACAPHAAPADFPGASGAPPPLVSSLQVEAEPGQVHLVLQVTNSAAEPVTLTFPSGQSYDFAVHADGEWIWRWSAGMGFTQAVREVTLAAGETITFSESWTPSGTLPPRLSATAWLTSSSHPVEQSVEFQPR
jgi:hypothetical protein